MADQNTATPTNTSTAGVPDRVGVLSLRADGSADQAHPQFVGDKDHALAATKRQFAVQATSAADVAARAVTIAEDVAGEVEASVKPILESHQKATAAAEAAAEKIVAALSKNA